MLSFPFPCSFFLIGRSMYVIRYWFWDHCYTNYNNNTKWQDPYFGKNSLKSIQSDVSIHEYRIRKRYVFCSFSLVPFSLLGRSMYVIRYWFWDHCNTNYNNNTKWQDAYFGKNSLKFIKSDVSIHEYRIRKKYVLFSLFLIPFSLLGRSMYVIRYWFWDHCITYRNNNTEKQDAYFDKSSLKSIKSDVSIHEYRIT